MFKPFGLVLVIFIFLFANWYYPSFFAIFIVTLKVYIIIIFPNSYVCKAIPSTLFEFSPLQLWAYYFFTSQMLNVYLFIFIFILIDGHPDLFPASLLKSCCKFSSLIFYQIIMITLYTSSNRFFRTRWALSNRRLVSMTKNKYSSPVVFP